MITQLIVFLVLPLCGVACVVGLALGLGRWIGVDLFSPYQPEHARRPAERLDLPALGSMCLDDELGVRAGGGGDRTLMLPRLGNGWGFIQYSDGSTEIWERTVPEGASHEEVMAAMVAGENPARANQPGPDETAAGWVPGSEPCGVTAPAPAISPVPGTAGLTLGTGDGAGHGYPGEADDPGGWDYDSDPRDWDEAALAELREATAGAFDGPGGGAGPSLLPVTTAASQAVMDIAVMADSPSPVFPFWDVLDEVKADARAFMAAQDAECAAFLSELAAA